ncbi:type 1 glutamine amidotransferase [Stappia sp.]|uniref:type 1 glutamine amidotransferase n=1 Tax=Stappia sp. TaxID=1870903 RepID=UPI0032D92276
MTRICIIENGLVPERLRARHGLYPDMARAWLAPHLPEAEFTTVSVVSGEPLPATPSDFDGYLLTGSKYGVYDDLPWMRDLRAFLPVLAEARIPMFGICFGHQIMAAAFGAQVRKSDKGVATGPQLYSHDGLGMEPREVLVFHQDQVETPPRAGRAAGGNDFCPLGVIAYDFPAFSVQYHPEFSKTFMQDLTEDLAGEWITREHADQAKALLAEAEVDTDALGEKVAALMRGEAAVYPGA